ncbi:MAG: ATP-binding protein [bacterium]|nr:ATP-binding protein [bacterium]
MRRSLGVQVFVSYLIVLVVGLVVLAAALNFLGSRHVARRIEGSGPRFGGPPATNIERIFRTGVADALVVAGIAAIVAAGALSIYVTRRIVLPVQALAAASQRLAAGHHDERVPVQGTDEMGALADSFNTMAEALGQTETRRRALLADVAHELRTPLSGIKGYMEGLSDGVLEAGPETYGRVAVEVDRLQRLVTDLEELSRLDAGVVPLTRQTVPVRQIVEAAVERLRQQAYDQGLILEVAVPEALPAVIVDVDRIQQVLLNLIGNAIQYTPPPGRITVRARSDGPRVRIDVEDTGVGIAAEHLAHVFERFYRVDRSRARSGGGSGLGLTIARYLVEAHGGSIRAASPGPGRGSTFSLTLPSAG